MEDEVGVYVIALVVAASISGAIAEFFGRGKHIGRNWTFALTLTTVFIGGIIALLASPSAKSKPTKGGQSYLIGAWVCFVFAALNIIMLNPLSIGFFVTGAYLWELSKGEIINKNPKYYIKNIAKQYSSVNNTSPQNNDGNYVTNHQKKATSFKERKKQLKNLRDKELLSELEYHEKLARIKVSELQNSFIKTEEYQQLKNLHEEGFLTDLELKEKIDLIKKKLLEESELDEDLESILLEDENSISISFIQDFNQKQFGKQMQTSSETKVLFLGLSAILFIIFLVLVWWEYK